MRINMITHAMAKLSFVVMPAKNWTVVGDMLRSLPIVLTSIMLLFPCESVCCLLE